mmetsp:Transcript_60000/g.193159  ORF Transcript_60000/g.193159 Transcript_60000/m.193159 type:complete len:200 (+) Transcript_60000:2110-2709(+)
MLKQRPCCSLLLGWPEVPPMPSWPTSGGASRCQTCWPSAASSATTLAAQKSPVGVFQVPGLAPRPATTRVLPSGPGTTAGRALASRSKSVFHLSSPVLKLKARMQPLPPKGMFQAFLPRRLPVEKTMPSFASATAPPVESWPVGGEPQFCLPVAALWQSTWPLALQKSAWPSTTLGTQQRSMNCTGTCHFSWPVLRSRP